MTPHLEEPQQELVAKPPTSSLLGSIREQAQHLAKDDTIDIPIAGYKRPELVARYRFVEHEEARELGERIRKDDQYLNDIDRAETALVDALIVGCIGIFAREGDQLEPVTPDDGGGPCVYDDRLETFFGTESSGSARASLLRAFKGNWLAAINHGRIYQIWLTDTSKKYEELVGEA